MDPYYEGPDPEIDALRKAKRKKALIVVAVILLPFLYWGMGFSTVQGYLEDAHFNHVEVSAGSSPFEFKFKAKRYVHENCRGSVSRLPFSMSHTSSCTALVDVNGQPVDPRSR
jgi:hypothetical protein